MNNIELGPRLAALAALVPSGSRVADIGTDHGLLPAWLRQNGRAEIVFATDIRPGPLQSARETAAKAGVGGIRFLLCDGLDGVRPGDVDTVVLAGMGGETIAGILERAPWTRNGVILLLQPMSKAEELRRRFHTLGLAAQSESLVVEGGRLYQIIVASGGTPAAYSEAELYTGLFEKIKADPLFLRYLEELISKTDRAIRGLKQASRPDDARLFRLLCAYSGFLEMRENIFDRGVYHAKGQGDSGLLGK